MFTTALLIVVKTQKRPKCPSMAEGKQNVVYTFNEILLSLKKEVSSDTCNNMDEPEDIKLSERSQS